MPRPSNTVASAPMLKTPNEAMATPHDKIRALETELNNRLIERQDAVRIALAALLSGQNMVLFGPPGTGKSLTITLLAQAIGLTKFIYLMTKFTTPEELFGPISVQSMKVDEYRRITDSRAPEAQILFLDEPARASSAVLNALLTLINERAFDNGGKRHNVPLVSLFGASNDFFLGPELSAFNDRFQLKMWVNYVSPAGFPKLMNQASSQASPNILRVLRNNNMNIPRPPQMQTYMSQDDLFALMYQTANTSISSGALAAIQKLYRDLGAKGITVSDRRWEQSLDAIRAHAVLDGRQVAEEDDLTIIKHMFWNTLDEQREIAKMVARLSNPHNAIAIELADQAESVYQKAMNVMQTSSDPSVTAQEVIQANNRLREIMTKLRTAVEQAQAEGRNPAKIKEMGMRVRTWNTELAQFLLGGSANDTI